MDTKIDQSTDYLKFKRIEGNRQISTSHLKSLSESIRQKNLLHLRPIIVDENFYVLDGQHRLEAAKECEVPIYYIVCNSEKFKEITKLNQNQKNWKFIDFLNFYALNYKNENYIKILDLMKEYNMSFDSILLFSKYNIKKREYREAFCNGDFIFTFDMDAVKSSISDWQTLFLHMKDKNCDFLDFFQTLQFKKALMEILESSKINRQQFWDRIKNNISQIYRCQDKDSTLDMLLKIYNKQSPYIVKKEELYLK